MSRDHPITGQSRQLVVQPAPIDVITIEDADWLDHLTENIIAIIVEAGYHIRQTKIRMYWLMGHEIITEEQRQLDAYEADPTRDHPASRAYIIRHVGQRLQKYEGFIGTGRTALYDAANFANLCPTEASLEEVLQKLKAGKNATWRHVCRHLLPGHEHDQSLSSAILYSGLATLFHNHSRGWSLTLPIGVELEVDPGDIVQVTIKKEQQ